MSWSAMVSSNGILLNDCTQGRLRADASITVVAEVVRLRTELSRVRLLQTVIDAPVLTDFFKRRPVAQIRRVRFWFALGVIFREALMA